MVDTFDYNYTLERVGHFIKISFQNGLIKDTYISTSLVDIQVAGTTRYIINKNNIATFELDSNKCTNISSTDLEDFLSQISDLFTTRIAQASGTQTEIATTQYRQLPPLGMGMESRIRYATTTEYERPSSVYMESNYINTVESSFGMPRLSNERIFSFKLTPGQLQITSTSLQDDIGGTGVTSIRLIGLTKIGGVWADIEETIVMDGQTPVLTASSDWWRINKIFGVTTGSSNFNVGDIYVTDAGAATTDGLPDVGVPVRGAMIAGFNNSTMGIFSVKTGYRFLYTKGNLYTVANANNPAVIHETGWYDYNDAGGNLSQYNVGYLGASGPVSYNYDGSAPYFQESDLDLRIFTVSGTLSSTVYYNEYVLVPNAAFS